MNSGTTNIKIKGTVETLEQVDIRHREMVKRLAKPGADILAALTAEDCYLIHIAGCIPGEVSELYVACTEEDDAQEELGDCQFYLRALLDCFELPRCADRIYQKTEQECLIELFIEGGKLWDCVKRKTIYRKPGDLGEMTRCIRAIETALNTIQCNRGHSMSSILDGNFQKLSKRYHAGSYSDAQAQQRADKQGGG